MNKAKAGWARAAFLTLAFASITACNSGGDNTNAGIPPSPQQPSDPNPPVPPISNVAPQISGSPSDKATVDQLFSFQPIATDSDGDRMLFSISSKPAWASFDPATGRLQGTPRAADIGAYKQIAISVSDGVQTRTLPQFSVTVAQRPVAVKQRKETYGHYFATNYTDTADDVAMLCEQAGVSGVVWRRTWNEVEPSAGVYDFSSFDEVLGRVATSRNPGCQVWLFVEYKSFKSSPVKNPCPNYLQGGHSAPNIEGNGASTCFMWEPSVMNAYIAMVKAAAARFDENPRVEGIIFQESALQLYQDYSQDVPDGGTYTAEAWRDALVQLAGQCGAAFSQSRCMFFLNFVHGGQQYLNDISAAISAVPDNRACFSGPDLLPDNTTLYGTNNSVYEVLVRHRGCRSNSAQNDSFEDKDCGLECIFKFAVKGNFGDFPEKAPITGGVCVNSYLFWNHRIGRSATGLTWTDALPVIAAHPYGPNWYEQCVGQSGMP